VYSLSYMSNNKMILMLLFYRKFITYLCSYCLKHFIQKLCICLPFQGAMTVSKMTLCIMTLSITKNKAQHNDIDHNVTCYVCSVSFMPSVINEPLVLSIVMLNVVMLSVRAPFSKLPSKSWNLYVAKHSVP
jgi:hypothetical protein